MFKRIRRSLLKKFYGGNPSLDRMLRSGFKNHPIMATITALYVFPVRNILKPSIDKIVNKQTFTVSKSYYDELQDLLYIMKAEDFNLVRIGRNYDGGYITLDDLPGGIAYSFGICDDVSWDKDVASRGYDVYMYDHTIDGLPERNPRFHWSKLGIADGVTNDDRLKTLEELISRNGHEGQRDMILKMDVEGAEWGFLESVKSETLSQFSQMTFELHDVINPSDTERVLSILRKINKTHQLVHLHANNSGNYITIGGKNFCSLFEVSYALRDKYKFSDEYDVNLPLEIDMPNVPVWPEIPLGHWNRKTEFDERIIYSSK